MSASFTLSQITKITFSKYPQSCFFMKERLTSRKIVHLSMVLVILLSPDGLSTWFSGTGSDHAEGSNVQICDLSHSPAASSSGIAR